MAPAPRRRTGEKAELLRIVKIALLIALLLGLLAFAVVGAVDAFRGVGLQMGVHGWIALGLGVVLSLALGIGLMSLTFFSARNGFDDNQHTDEL